MHENEISERIIGCAIQVHKALGPGLLESVYEECMAAEMDAVGLRYERQRPVPVIYRTVKLNYVFYFLRVTLCDPLRPLRLCDYL